MPDRYSASLSEILLIAVQARRLGRRSISARDPLGIGPAHLRAALLHANARRA